MTTGMDAPHRVGASRIAALSEQVVASANAGAGGWFGAKRPIAVLVMWADQMSAFDLRGREISIADLRRQYPELIGRLATCVDEAADRRPD